MSTDSKRAIKQWKVVDLFSGCGGMSAGFRAYKKYFEIVGAVDLEVAKPGKGKSKASTTKCNATYCRNIGSKPKSANLATLNPQSYRAELGLDKSVSLGCLNCMSSLYRFLTKKLSKSSYR